MCRFCACALSKSELSKKCIYRKSNIDHEVNWVSENFNSVCDYHPSNLLKPKDTGLPVILDGKHLSIDVDRIFCPMYWSLIPSWYNGQLNEWNATTHNARVENLWDSKIYSAALNEGKRCVVVMEGFYEFKKSGSQPSDVYYLHATKNDQLLNCAGLFSCTKRDDGETVYTCSVITCEAESNAKQVHHRLPLILQDDAELETWIKFRTVTSADALGKIKSNKKQPDLNFYKTAKVGSREPANAKKPLASKSMMTNWLNSSNNKGLKRKAED